MSGERPSLKAWACLLGGLAAFAGVLYLTRKQERRPEKAIFAATLKRKGIQWA